MSIPKPRFSIASLLVFIALCALLFGLLSWQYRTLALARAEAEQARMAAELAQAESNRANLEMRRVLLDQQAHLARDAGRATALDKQPDASQELNQRETTLEKAPAAYEHEV